MNLDPQFINIGLALVVNIVSQIAKRFHTDAFTVFKIAAFHVCLIYGAISFLGYKEQLASIAGSLFTVVGLASGFWHLVMRPEGPVMQWWNNRNKTANK